MKKLSIFAVVLGAGLMAGCPFTPGNGGGDATVLEGTWDVTLAEPGDLVEITATFDADGKLQTITAENAAGGTATLEVDDATTSTVDGSDVTVTIPAAGGAITLEGTLSEDEDTIEGTLSRELDLQSGDLTIPAGDVTLTRAAE